MHSSFTYEQFADWTWDEVFKFNAKPKEKTIGILVKPVFKALTL